MRTTLIWLLGSLAMMALLMVAVYLSPQWGFLPHRFCLLEHRVMMAAYVTPNAVIAVAYFAIPVSLFVIVSTVPDAFFRRPVVPIVYAFAAFIFFCGLTHVMDMVTVWWPAYYLQMAVLNATAIASVATVYGIWRLGPEIRRLARKDAD